MHDAPPRHPASWAYLAGSRPVRVCTPSLTESKRLSGRVLAEATGQLKLSAQVLRIEVNPMSLPPADKATMSIGRLPMIAWTCSI